jgi:hypothetical protein
VEKIIELFVGKLHVGGVGVGFLTIRHPKEELI